jgi:coenzyme PQQ synthesis protein D (PqqD)
MSLRFVEKVTVAETDFGAVILQERTGRYWRLNPTAVLVVRALLAGVDEDEVLRQVVDAFDVEPAQAQADIAELIAGMRGAGVVR